MAKPFGWTGATRRRALADRIVKVAQDWWKAWALAPAVVDVVEGGEATLSGGFLLFESRGRMAVHAGQGLASALTGIDAAQEGDLARHVSRAAVTDLARRVMDAQAGPACTEPDALPEDLADERLGACAVTLDGGGARLSLWFDRGLLQRLAPPAPARPKPLCTRIDAVAAARATMAVSLDLGEIALSELHGLRPGDVIATLAPLSRPFGLSTGDRSNPLFHGRLGEQGGHRALLLAADISESHT